MLIKTKSFTLAAYVKGDLKSSKLAIVLPGKLDTKDYAHMKSHVEFLANFGFLALSFDPPGTWESNGDIQLYSTTNYIKAVNELIEYFGNKQAILVGHSRGGSVAMIAGAKNPRVMAFVGIMFSFTERGFNNEKDKLWEKSGFATSMRDLPPGGGPKVKKFDLPYSFFIDQLKYEGDDQLEKSTKPKLLILGKYDTTVPVQTRDYCDLLKDPKEVRELESDHDYRHHPNLIADVNKILEKFLLEHKLI